MIDAMAVRPPVAVHWTCLGVMAMAVVTDTRTGRIPNALTVPSMAAGIFFHGLLSGYGGLIHSAAGLLAGLTLLIVFFRMGGMGGGDVKLLGAAGAWLGPRMILMVGLSGLFIGGLCSLSIIIRQTGRKDPGRIVRVLSSITMPSHHKDVPVKTMGTYPYSIPLALGYVLFLVLFFMHERG